MAEDVRARLGRLFGVGEPQKSGAGKPQPGELFRGAGWFVSQEGAALLLHYVSGEVGGRDMVVPITPSEARTLKSGDDAAALAVLAAHGVG